MRTATSPQWKAARWSPRSATQVSDISNQLDAVHHLVGEELTEISHSTFANKIERLAKADHVIWKKQFCDMAVGRAKLRADELSDHHSCRLGKWYYGDASLRSRGKAAFVRLEKPHALVHQHGKQAARLMQNGELHAALSEIQCVDAASKDVLRLLDELIK